MLLKSSAMKIKLITLEDAQQPFLKQALHELEQKKKSAIESGNETFANDCWREIAVLKLNMQYIEAFNQIKTKEYRKAWEALEQCEIQASFIKENSDERFFIEKRCAYIVEKVTMWQSLFPYCVFASPGFTVGYYTCSICDHKIRPKSRCAHSRGKIYFGELCTHIAHDLEMQEISIVTKPVQKYSVMHNDETLDFSLINYPAELLDNAFEQWEMNWTRMSFPIENFKSVLPDAECPCKIGNVFSQCCMNKENISIPHVDFGFWEEKPEEKTKLRFPYS